MPSSAPRYPPPATESRRALHHYERAIAALRSEPYRDMPPDLRADLLRRLRRERDALLRAAGHSGGSPSLPFRPLPAALTTSD